MEITLAQRFVQYVHEDLLQIKQPHFDIAFRLKEAKDLNYAEELGFANIYDLAEKEFGFKRSSCAAYIAVCENFMSGMQVKERFASFSYSQLCEMLALDGYDRTLIKPTMTVRQIREWKKNHKIVPTSDGRYLMYGDLSAKEKQLYDEKVAKKNEKSKEECESVQTSGQTEEQSEELPDEDLQNFEKDIVVKPIVTVAKRPLLGLKNKQERSDFLDEYKSWGVWLSVPELNLTCYKYKFANGHEVVVSEYLEHLTYSTSKDRSVVKRYHLITDTIPFFDLGGIAKTYVLDYMTEHAKEI